MAKKRAERLKKLKDKEDAIAKDQHDAKMKELETEMQRLREKELDDLETQLQKKK